MKIKIKNKTCNIDEESVIIKWSPILDALKIYDEKTRKYVSLYCEVYKLNEDTPSEFKTETQSGKISETSIKDVDHILNKNLLPLSIRILSKLNLTDKEIEITTTKSKVEEHSSSVTISKAVLKQFKEKLPEFDIVVQCENIIQNQIILDINKILKDNNKLIVKNLTKSLEFVDDKKTDNINIILKSEYKII